MIAAVPLFRDFTDLEHTSISNRSLKLFTLSSLHQATAQLLAKSQDKQVAAEDGELAIKFWNEVIRHMPDWRRVQSREVAAAELRRDYIHAHGIAVQAIAIAGAQLLATHPKDWSNRLGELRKIDWARANRELWDGRALVAGKVNKSKNNVTLVSNVILRALGLPLKSEAARIEALYGAAPVGRLKKAG